MPTDEIFSSKECEIYYHGTDILVGYGVDFSGEVAKGAEAVRVFGSSMPKDIKMSNIGVSGSLGALWTHSYLAHIAIGTVITPNREWRGVEASDTVDGFTFTNAASDITETYTASSTEFKMVADDASVTGDLQVADTIAVTAGYEYLYEIKVKTTPQNSDAGHNMIITWNPDSGSLADTEITGTATSKWFRGVVTAPTGSATLQPQIKVASSYLDTPATGDEWAIYAFRLYGTETNQLKKSGNFDIAFKLTGSETKTFTAKNAVFTRWGMSATEGDTTIREDLDWVAEDIKITQT